MNQSSACECEATAKEKYVSRFNAFSAFYLHLVIAVGLSCAAAIVIAVVFNVILGIALAFFSSAVYMYFTAAELKRQLGISYRNTNGSIIITRIKAVYGDTVYIPTKLLWCDVTEINDRALVPTNGAGFESIYIPKSISRIGKDIFGDTPVDAVIYYEGSADEWKNVYNKTDFSGIEIVFGTPQPNIFKKGNKLRKRKEVS